MKKHKTYINKPTHPIVYGHEVSVDLSPDISFEPSTVNDAELKSEAYNSGVRFMRPIMKEDGYVVSDLIMTFPQGLRMGDVFDRIPYGIVNKTITGLGATTLEIMSIKRNSIIVVPTKTLAYSKVKKANQENGDGYAMYIGSPIGDIKSTITINNVTSYIANKHIGDVQKFIVVADSLPMLINYLEKLKIDAYSDYFLMVDEIDTLQSDSSYRPRLEAVIDHYFKFDFDKRAVVSATMIPFSNPKFEKESSLRIEWEQQPKREIKVRYANYIEDAAINEINFLLESTSDKIIVAYNSLDGIFNIIEQLDIDKRQCGVLCSNRSADKVELYKDIEDEEKAIDENGNLLHRVTFLTCAYFAGIDIMDRCHLITITSKIQPYTYLSINKITQIAGRCRNGNLSETILYDTPEKKEYIKERNSNEFKQTLIDKAVSYINFLNSGLEIINKDKSLEPMRHFLLSFMDYISNAKSSKVDYPLTIIRQDSLSNAFVPAYFNIDALTEKWELRHSLYSEENKLYKVLKIKHNVEELSPFIMKREEHIDANKENRAGVNAALREKELVKLKADLLEWKNQNGNEFAFKEIVRRTRKKYQDTIIKAFEILHPYYQVEELLDVLISVANQDRKFRNIYNAALFYVLPSDETFKAKILLKFGCDIMTGESSNYISADLRIMLIEESIIETFHIKPKTDRKNLSELATSFLSFKTSKGLYCPDGFNPKKLPTPITLMPVGLLSFSMFMLPFKG